jgi:hypothetical protein
MVNLKLGIAALLLELGAWSGPLLMGGSTDSALASYLLVHALACVMLSLFLFPLLSTRQARPRLAIVLLMMVCSYAVPVAGFLGVLAAALVLRLYRKPATHTEFESLQMPEFDQHQRRQGHFRHAGLRSFLGNIHAPIQSRLRAMVALQYVSGRTASPLLRTVLSDPSEDLRLLAYGMLDTLEKRVNSSIDAEMGTLRAAQAEGGNAGLRTLESAQRLSDLYWELIYQDLVQGDLRKHAIQESLRYCDWVLAEQADNAQLCLRRGRLLHEQKRPDEAAQAYAQARELGLPATRVLPYQAELCFDRKDFAQAHALMQELGQWSALPRLRPVVDYWSGR